MSTPARVVEQGFLNGYEHALASQLIARSERYQDFIC